MTITGQKKSKESKVKRKWGSICNSTQKNLEDIPEDPGNAFPAETGLLEFCITHLENVLMDKDNNQDMEYLNDKQLQVCCFLSGKS